MINVLIRVVGNLSLQIIIKILGAYLVVYTLISENIHFENK